MCIRDSCPPPSRLFPVPSSTPLFPSRPDVRTESLPSRISNVIFGAGIPIPFTTGFLDFLIIVRIYDHGCNYITWYGLLWMQQPALTFLAGILFNFFFFPCTVKMGMFSSLKLVVSDLRARLGASKVEKIWFSGSTSQVRAKFLG